MKPRNHTLALVAKNDPSRFCSRTVETKKQKLIKNRSRRKQTLRRSSDFTVTVEYLGT